MNLQPRKALTGMFKFKPPICNKISYLIFTTFKVSSNLNIVKIVLPHKLYLAFLDVAKISKFLSLLVYE